MRCDCKAVSANMKAESYTESEAVKKGVRVYDWSEGERIRCSPRVDQIRERSGACETGEQRKGGRSVGGRRGKLPGRGMFHRIDRFESKGYAVEER